jgi:hypothetical protein
LRGTLIAWPIALAAILVTDGVAGLALGHEVSVTPGNLALFGLLPLTAVFLVHMIGRHLRRILPTGIGVVLVVGGLFSVPWLLPRPVLATYPAWTALTAGVLLAAITIPWAARPDPIVDPRTGPNRYAPTRRTTLLMITATALPLLVLVITAMFLTRTG